MATTFPSSIQEFEDRLDIEETDLSLVNQYQSAMQSGNFALAKQILVQIPNYNKKIIQSDYLNDINDTLDAVQKYFADRYSPAYVVSETQPQYQSSGDFWFEIEV